jgi:hypothetical protein
VSWPIGFDGAKSSARRAAEVVQADGHVPTAQRWHELLGLLPEKKHVGASCEPPLSLILGAWWETTAAQKMLRPKEHIEYAASKGALDSVEHFLRSLHLGSVAHHTRTPEHKSYLTRRSWGISDMAHRGPANDSPAELHTTTPSRGPDLVPVYRDRRAAEDGDSSGDRDD